MKYLSPQGWTLPGATMYRFPGQIRSSPPRRGQMRHVGHAVEQMTVWRIGMPVGPGGGKRAEFLFERGENDGAVLLAFMACRGVSTPIAMTIMSPASSVGSTMPMFAFGYKDSPFVKVESADVAVPAAAG